MSVPSSSYHVNLDEIYKLDVRVYYIQGESTKKTEWALNKISELGYGRNYDRVYHKKGVWHGVSKPQSKEVALYEDFSDKDMNIKEFISFIDYYVNPLDVAYSYSMNFYKYIFIISWKDFDKLYSRADKYDKERIKARTNYINIINL